MEQFPNLLFSGVEGGSHGSWLYSCRLGEDLLHLLQHTITKITADVDFLLCTRLDVSAGREDVD